MDDTIALQINSVSKQFLLPHEKKTTVKSLFTNLFRQGTTITKQRALKDISFEVKKGEFFGIVGRNGSGKSTLLKIIAGIYQPTHGSVKVNGRLVPFIELGVGFNPELTGRENVFLNGAILGFTPKQIQKNYKKIVEFAELEAFMDQKLKNYSSGMQVRLAFACTTMADADILLIDEVLAVGDADFQRKCFRYFKELKRDKKTVIFVTHDMNAVREYCDRAVLISDSEVVSIGTPDVIARQYSELFIVEDSNTSMEDVKINRWGNGAAKYSNSKANVSKDNILVSSDVNIPEDLGNLIYGIHIIAEDGTEITAMNNRMIFAPDIKKPIRGEVVSIEWSILNIFNDGNYTVNLTLINDETTTLDWLVGACSFKVKRAERSTTSVFPPTKVKVNIR